MSVLETALADILKIGGRYISKHGSSEIGEIIEGLGEVGKDIYDALRDDIENHPLEATLTVVAAAAIPIVFPALIPAIATGIVGASGSIAGSAGITAIETFIVDRLGIFFGEAAISVLQVTAQKIATTIASDLVRYGSDKIASGLFSIVNHLSAKFVGQNETSGPRFVQNPNGTVSIVIPNQSVVTNFLNNNNGIIYHNTIIENNALVDIGKYGNNVKHVDTYRFIGGNSTLRIDGLSDFSGTISNFDVGDNINLAQVGNLPSVSLGPNNHLLIHLQNGSTKTLSLSKEESYTGKLFETNMSPTGGANIVLADVSATPTDPVISEDGGSEQFTLTRDGDISGSATVYVSTTDDSTVSGESVNAGNINPFVYQPVTFAAGSSTAQIGVDINDIGLYDGSTDTYGIEVTSEPSQNNILASSQFTIQNKSEQATFIYNGSPMDDVIYNSNQTNMYYGKSAQAKVVVANYDPNYSGPVYNEYLTSASGNSANPFIESITMSFNGQTYDETNNPEYGSFSLQKGTVTSWNLTDNDQNNNIHITNGVLNIMGEKVFDAYIVPLSQSQDVGSTLPGVWTMLPIGKTS